jgi:hypothetical protein
VVGGLRRSPSGGSADAAAGNHNETLHPDKAKELRGSVAVIKGRYWMASGILARAAERRAVRQVDYDAATRDVQELVSVTVCAVSRVAEHFDDAPFSASFRRGKRGAQTERILPARSARRQDGGGQ